MKKIMDGLKKVWDRITSSKVAWMAVPAGVAQIVLAVWGKDVSETLNAVFAGVWMILAVFLAVNNPTDAEHF